MIADPFDGLESPEGEAAEVEDFIGDRLRQIEIRLSMLEQLPDAELDRLATVAWRLKTAFERQGFDCDDAIKMTMEVIPMVLEED